jgi:hypothetical protein
MSTADQMEAKRTSRKLQKPPPELLALLLQHARSLPADIELPKINQELDVVDEFSHGDVGRRLLDTRSKDFLTLVPSVVREAIDRFNSIIDGLPKSFGNYLSSQTQGISKFYDIIQMMVAYSNFIENRERLRIILHITLRSQGKRSTRFSFAHVPAFSGALHVNEEGRFVTTLDPLFIELEGVEASRVRECAVCRHIFWAGRLDQKCCTTQCAKTLRTRRWRERYYHVGESPTTDGYKLRRLRKLQQKEKVTRGE